VKDQKSRLLVPLLSPRLKLSGGAVFSSAFSSTGHRTKHQVYWRKVCKARVCVCTPISPTTLCCESWVNKIYPSRLWSVDTPFHKSLWKYNHPQ